MSLSILKSAPILVPPPSLISSFDEIGRTISQLVDVNSAKIEILRTTREFLLPKLLSGKIPIEAAEEHTADLAAQSV